MFRNFLGCLCLVFLVSCNCQKIAKSKERDNLKEVSIEKIRSFLRPDNFEILDSANLVVVYDIKKIPIEGSSNEYSNKTVLNDTLAVEKSNQLLTYLKNDASYEWSATDVKGKFDPNCQVLIKNNTKRIFLLIDENRKKLGFINLEGQKILQFSHESPNFFENF